MTEENKNVKIVKEMLAAFERGDLKSVIARIADNVEWQSPVSTGLSGHIPWATPRHGIQEVEEFFKEVLESVSPRLTAVRYTAEGDRVIVEGSDRGTVKATGTDYVIDWVMVFSFVNGKVTMLYHYYDTLDLLRALGADVRKAA